MCNQDTRKATKQSVDRFCNAQFEPPTQPTDHTRIFALRAPESDDEIGPEVIAPLNISQGRARLNLAFGIIVPNGGDYLRPIGAALIGPPIGFEVLEVKNVLMTQSVSNEKRKGKMTWQNQ